MIKSIVWAALFASAAGFATEPLPDIGFPGLNVQRFRSDCVEASSVHFDPHLASPKDQFEPIEDHPAGGMRLVLQGRLSAESRTEYLFKFDDGPSCDPEFTVWNAEGGKDDGYVGSFSGEHLIVPGNGYLYVVRATNRSFEGREKWAIEGGELKEVKQPFYYVGKETRTLKALELRAEPSDGSVILARLPKGETVTVVLQQSVEDIAAQYLVRTRFGLVGWTTDTGYGDDRSFEGLQFLGD
jgi:hypothetical protein